MGQRFNAVIQFDETKPHWAERRKYRERASMLGMKDTEIGGDFDTKIALIYGRVENFEAFKNAVENDPVLSGGSVYRVQGAA